MSLRAGRGPFRLACLFMFLTGVACGEQEEEYVPESPDLSVGCPGTSQSPRRLCVVEDLRLTPADHGALVGVRLGDRFVVDFSGFSAEHRVDVQVFESSLVRLDTPPPSAVRPVVSVSAAAVGTGRMLVSWWPLTSGLEPPEQEHHTVVVIPPPSVPVVLDKAWRPFDIVAVFVGGTVLVPAQPGYGEFATSGDDILSLDRTDPTTLRVTARGPGVAVLGQKPPPCKQLSRIPCAGPREVTVVVL